MNDCEERRGQRDTAHPRKMRDEALLDYTAKEPLLDDGRYADGDDYRFREHELSVWVKSLRQGETHHGR